MTQNYTATEAAFRDSAEGREAIAYAKSCAATRDAMGATRGWNDADERATITAALIVRDNRRRQIADATAARPARQAMETAALEAVRDTIRANRNR